MRRQEILMCSNKKVSLVENFDLRHYIKMKNKRTVRDRNLTLQLTDFMVVEQPRFRINRHRFLINL
jgi:hypothetical protein